MSERDLNGQLDDAIEALMRDVDSGSAGLSPAIERLLQVAAGLRGLPRPDFKQRLKGELEAMASARTTGPRPITPDNMHEIDLALEELESSPRLRAHDLADALKDTPELGMQFLEHLNGRTVGVSRFSDHSHWERHPAADEMLYLIDGDAEVTTLTASGPVISEARAGSVFICPRGLWHRVQPKGEISLLFATPGEGTEHSSTEAPPDPPHATAGTTDLVAHDVRAAVTAVPVLDIDATTTAGEADAAFVEIAKLDECTFYGGRFRGLSPWERHRNGDELLHVLGGEVDITVLTDDGPVQRTVRQGNIFVCPRGLWHRQHARGFVTMLSGTPGPTDTSWEHDPRE